MQQLNVYPNPTEGEVFVQFVFDGTKNIQIRMVDLAGRLIYSRNMGTYSGMYSSILDLSGQPAGTYLMFIQAGEHTKVQRIVVK
ncbi:MAG: T9SS type A sorting domain-containing protein [Flavobacteriales bacterium]|nr:T9SS type A sorting domain-containing protein [Flavobacteriales bacterium]